MATSADLSFATRSWERCSREHPTSSQATQHACADCLNAEATDAIAAERARWAAGLSVLLGDLNSQAAKTRDARGFDAGFASGMDSAARQLRTVRSLLCQPEGK